MGSGELHYFRNHPGDGISEFRASLEMFRANDDTTMEAWALHMLGIGLLRRGETEEARSHIEHAFRHFHAAGDVAGLTMTLDDLSAQATAEGDLVRAARLRGAARHLTVETGAELARYVEDNFGQGGRPGVGAHMSEADIAMYGAEGAAMTLDEAVIYALRQPSDDVPHGTPEA